MEERKDSAERRSFSTVVADFTSLSLASLLLGVAIVITFVANNPYPQHGVLTNSSSDCVTVNRSQLQPAEWTYQLMWCITYAWQILLLVYAWTVAARIWSQGSIHWLVYAFHSLASVVGIIWNALRATGHDIPSYLFLFLLVVSVSVAVGVESAYLHYYAFDLDLISKADLWLARVIVVNGLAVYVTWTLFLCHVDLAAIVQCHTSVNASGGAMLALILLTLELIVYFILENVVLQRFTRFVFVVQPTVILVAACVIADHRLRGDADEEKATIFLSILLVITAIAFAVKVVVLVCRPILTKVSRNDYASMI